MMFCAADPVRNLAGFHLPGSCARIHVRDLTNDKGEEYETVYY